MAEWILEPYAATVRWHVTEPGVWTARMGEYLTALAGRCAARGSCVIGHLKALALFADEGFLQVSVVGVDLPVTVQGQEPPEGAGLTMTLNALVYGIPRAQIAELAADVAETLARRWKGEVTIESGGGQENPASGHAHNDQPAH